MIIDLALPDTLKKDLLVAADILLREGCKEIYIFGSVALGTFTADSDIDIATVGLPKVKFFSAYGQLLAKLRRHVDLVGLDYDKDFGRMLREKGLLTRVA